MPVLRAELDELVLPDERYSRRPRARACGLEVVATRRSDAVVCALCRKLVAAGHDPALPMEVYRGSTLALRVSSIGEAAGLTVVERPRGGRPQFGKFTPYPDQDLTQDAISDPPPMQEAAE